MRPRSKQVQRLALLVLTIVSSCADPLTNDTTTAPVWYTRNAIGYAHTVKGEPPDAVLGWGLVIEGDVARWHECVAVDVCSSVDRQLQKSDVLAVETIGMASVTGDGGTVDVLKLTLAPGRKYVVPYTNPVKTGGR
jgi:hypothetical protein